jgi:hypothetical protein
LTVTGAAANAGGLAAKAKTRPSTTTAPSAPSTCLALDLSENELQAEPADIDAPRSSVVRLAIGLKSPTHWTILSLSHPRA